MKKERVKKGFEYVRKNSLKFLSLLVVLSLCSAMRYAAIGKYSTFLQDSTQVVAGESFFASNYLKEVSSVDDITESKSNNRVTSGEGTSYFIPIGTWNKYDYVIPFEVRNYNNSLKFNELDEQNTYFYVVAEFFKDPECQYPADAVPGPSEELSFNYVDRFELSATITYIQEISNSEPRTVKAYGEVGKISKAGIEYPVSLIKGGAKNTQKVEVRVRTGGEDNKYEPAALYIRVAAYTIAPNDLSKIELTPITGVTTAYNTQASTSAIYYQMLGGLFQLGSNNATANITCIPQDNENTLQLILKVACSAMEYQSEATARIYYKSENLTFGTEEYEVKSVGTDAGEIAKRRQFFEDNFYAEGMSDEEKQAVQDRAATLDKYIQFTVQTGNLKELIFLKDRVDGYNADYYAFGVVIDHSQD